MSKYHYKKTDLTKCDNSREISLLPVPSKILSRLNLFELIKKGIAHCRNVRALGRVSYID